MPKSDLSRSAAALIGALQFGVPVDWESLGDEAEAADDPEPIGLQRIWREVYKPWAERDAAERALVSFIARENAMGAP